MAVILIIFGVSAYIYSINRPDIIKSGATQIVEHEQNWPLSISIGKGGCATLGGKSAKDSPTVGNVTNKH